MKDMLKDYSKTLFAMRALESAVAEETAGEDQGEVRAVAMTVISGVAVLLANVVIGEGTGRDSFNNKAASEALKMLVGCFDGTIRCAFTEVTDETHTN